MYTLCIVYMRVCNIIEKKNITEFMQFKLVKVNFEFNFLLHVKCKSKHIKETQ